MAARDGRVFGPPQREVSVSGETAASQRAGIVLVGFMGVGKTSVGRALSKRLGWPFEDLDDRIEALQGTSIERIFQEHGEAAFRRAENDALRRLLAELPGSPRVIALGGGAFVQPDNRELLAGSWAATVFLDAPVEELFRRCKRHGGLRPLFGNLREFQALHEKRREHYLKAAFRVETGNKDVDAVALEVACLLGMGSMK